MASTRTRYVDDQEKTIVSTDVLTFPFCVYMIHPATHGYKNCKFCWMRNPKKESAARTTEIGATSLYQKALFQFQTCKESAQYE